MKGAQRVFVVASEYGPALVFDNVEALEQLIANLQHQLEWIQANDIQPRYIHLITHNTIPTAEREQWATWLKWIMQQDMSNNTQ